MKMIAFTICSNNYLPKAQVLAASLKARSAVEVYLVLADNKSALVEYKNLGFDRVIFPEELPISNLLWMKENYNIIEFNTALKSFAFEFIFSETSCNSIYYFDPDIKVYQPLEAFEKYWSESNIVL